MFDAFIQRTLHQFVLHGDLVFEHRLASFQRRPGQRSRRFLSLNFNARATKMIFLLRLLRDDLWDKGWISFGGFASENNSAMKSRAGVVKRLRALDGFEDDVRSMRRLVDRLDRMGPILFDMRGGHEENLDRKSIIAAEELPQYEDSWFSVVTETHMSDRLHRITEKPLKPLLNLHPFLVLGSAGSLQLLRDYGFETYGDVLDERYDSELNPRRRFDMVYDQVRRLCDADEAELVRMTEQASEILAFNACWGLTKLPRIINEKIGAELIDQLAPASRAGRRPMLTAV